MHVTWKWSCPILNMKKSTLRNYVLNRLDKNTYDLIHDLSHEPESMEDSGAEEERRPLVSKVPGSSPVMSGS